MTILAHSINSDNNDNLDNISFTQSDIMNPIQIPIVGYEIMEERARFTVRHYYLLFVLN